MKKSFSKLILLSISTIFLLTSCLGESDNSASIDQTYAYISMGGSLGTVKVANVISTAAAAVITNQTLVASDLQAGDCAIIGFKINANNTGDGYYNADYINLPADENKIFRKGDQVIPWIAEVDTINSNNEAYFSNLPTTPTYIGISDFVIYNYEMMGYRWFITYQYVKKKSEDSPKLRLYFDKEKQVNLNQSALASDEIVLDFRLEAQGSASTNPLEETKNERQTDAINFTNMINYLDDQVSKGSKKTFSIKFRYFKKVDSPKDGEPAYKLTMTSNYVTAITIDKTATNS